MVLFFHASGLKLSLDKSQDLGINIADEVVDLVAKRLKCEWGVCPINYLSLPVCVNPRSQIFWKVLIFRAGRRLEGCKRAIYLGGQD